MIPGTNIITAGTAVTGHLRIAIAACRRGPVAGRVTTGSAVRRVLVIGLRAAANIVTAGTAKADHLRIAVAARRRCPAASRRTGIGTGLRHRRLWQGVALAVGHLLRHIIIDIQLLTSNGLGLGAGDSRHTAAAGIGVIILRTGAKTASDPAVSIAIGQRGTGFVAINERPPFRLAARRHHNRQPAGIGHLLTDRVRTGKNGRLDRARLTNAYIAAASVIAAIRMGRGYTKSSRHQQGENKNRLWG